MKKIIGITIISLFLVSVLFVGIGCKEEAAAETEAATEAAAETEAAETTEAAAETEAAEAEPITIVYMAKWNEGEVMQGIINDALDKYEADNPNVTIDRIWGGREVNAALMAAIQAGNPPDIYDEDPAIIKNSLVKDGLALDLWDYMQNTNAYGEEVTVASLYPKGLLEVFLEDGKLFAFPTHQFVSAFWYNKTQFEELGITTTPNTWTEFLELCQTIKDKGVAPIVQDGGINFYNSYYYTYLAARYEGGNTFREAIFDKTGAALDAPGFLEAAKKVEELYDLGYFIDGFEGYQWPAGQIDWAQGAGAMMYNHSYLPIEVKDSLAENFVFGAFPFPAVEGGKGDQYEMETSCGADAILASTKYPDVCFDILSSKVSEEVQSRIMNEALTLPVRTGISLPIEFADFEDILAKQTGAFMNYAGGPGQIEPEWEQQVFYPLDDQLLFGKITGEEFMTQLKEKTVAYWANK